MAIEELELELSGEPVPPEIQRIVDASDQRIDALFASGENKRVPKYIPSDPVLLYKALANLTERDIPLGRVLCEWGSGFGAGACIGAELGYTSYGLEIEPSLAASSRAMAADLGVAVTILETSYLPDGFESYSGIGGEYLIKDEGVFSRDTFLPQDTIYEGMEHEIAEIDVFFVYPWPLEQELMQQLFDEIAVEGAILISYHKAGEVCAFQKISEDEED